MVSLFPEFPITISDKMDMYNFFICIVCVTDYIYNTIICINYLCNIFFNHLLKTKQKQWFCQFLFKKPQSIKKIYKPDQCVADFVFLDKIPCDS